MAIDERVTLVTQVTMRRGEKEAGSATGFFYYKGEALFLITNRHVVKDEEEGHAPDKLLLKLHTDATDIRRNEALDLDLYKGGKPSWLEHPKYGSKVDVVAIPLSSSVRERFVIRPVSKKDMIPDDIQIQLGEELLVIGFPLGFHDRMFNLPIVRTATLASVYPVPFEGHPFVLVESRLHRGTSGSPVMTRPTNLLRKVDGSLAMTNRPVSWFVGIHSAALDLPDRDPSKDEPLGLNCVWFGGLIEDILSTV